MDGKQEKPQIFSNVQEASERLDAIIENSFDGIYITDGRANTIKVNRAYETITGLDRADMLGKNMEELERGNVISVSGSLMAIREKRVVTLEQEFKKGGHNKQPDLRQGRADHHGRHKCKGPD